uniref:Uncharacterized protein n=1 Tax=Arundo donax TaxID=35708 RepID=A0A0A9HSG7_ARUDO
MRPNITAHKLAFGTAALIHYSRLSLTSQNTAYLWKSTIQKKI